jgi:hypothetical protein
MQRVPIVASLLALTLVLAACGTPRDPNGQDPVVQTDQVGMVTLLEIVPYQPPMNTLQNDLWNGVVFGSGIFLQSDEPIPSVFLADPFAAATGMCEVTALGELEEPITLPGWEFVATTVDAGDQLTIQLDDGPTFAVMVRDSVEVDGETWIQYVLEEGEGSLIGGPLPAGLLLTVPGADFPAFDDVPFPALPAFELTAPAFIDFGTVTADTAFTWEGAASVTGVDSVVFLELVVDDAGGASYVTCYAQDVAGTFTFPTETVDALPEDFTAQLQSAGRIAYSANDDAEEGARLFTASGSLVLYDEVGWLPPNGAFGIGGAGAE